MIIKLPEQKDLTKPYRWFAWRPVLTNCSYWVWLNWVWVDAWRGAANFGKKIYYNYYLTKPE